MPHECFCSRRLPVSLAFIAESVQIKFWPQPFNCTVCVIHSRIYLYACIHNISRLSGLARIKNLRGTSCH